VKHRTKLRLKAPPGEIIRLIKKGQGRNRMTPMPQNHKKNRKKRKALSARKVA